MTAPTDKLPSRRAILGSGIAAAACSVLPRGSLAQSKGVPAIDATFLFIADVHACRMNSGLSPNCLQEGKTDENLLRHITAINRIAEQTWPETIDGVPTGLKGSGRRIGKPLGIVLGGDMTDDGGGQVTTPAEGTQLLQFSHRYQEGVGPDRVHFPVYAGLGNHDLDQDGPPPQVDWYRRELRDYVEVNHRPSVFFKPPVPASDYDTESDCYSWDWGGLHLIQAHRFAGDASKDAVSGLPWLARNLKSYAGDGRPVILFQHYGWDSFSTERWDPAKVTFDDQGAGAPHWWSEADRQALADVFKGYNVVAIFHGHQHPTPMIYSAAGIDLFKPIASFMGGMAVARVTSDRLEVALAKASDTKGDVVFTNAFSKAIGV